MGEQTATRDSSVVLGADAYGRLPSAHERAVQDNPALDRSKPPYD